MGFLQRSTGDPLNFNKVVISFWFYIPAAAIAAAADKFEGNSGFQFWMGVIPLLTWGPQSTGLQYEINGALLGNEPGIGDIFGTVIGSDYGNPQGPSYIGIRCDGETAKLEVLIQADNAAACTATSYVANGYFLTGPPENTYEHTHTDASHTDEGYKDYFGNVSETQITPDAWHHLLISWDLAGGSASQGEAGGGTVADNVTASSHMWAALDDTNKTGDNLPMLWPGDDFDVNRHVSAVVENYAGSDENPIGTPAVTLTVGTIPAVPLSIPGPGIIDISVSGGLGNTEADAPVLKAAMADLQIYTGVSLNTAIEDNRRAFITSDLKPAAPALAATLMEKNPEVLFQTYNDWNNGNNRGTANGTFTKTGTINTFSPGPGA